MSPSILDYTRMQPKEKKQYCTACVTYNKTIISEITINKTINK
jgi:hypothetical protein